MIMIVDSVLIMIFMHGYENTALQPLHDSKLRSQLSGHQNDNLPSRAVLLVLSSLYTIQVFINYAAAEDDYRCVYSTGTQDFNESDM